MKRKFIITEVVSYTAEAESAAQAERIFEDALCPDTYFASSSGREIEAAEPNPVKVGDLVNVDAHGEHDEDFSGEVLAVVGDLYVVKAPDGAAYDCEADYVYVPEDPQTVLREELAEKQAELRDARSAGGEAGPGEIDDLREEIAELKAELKETLARS